MLILCNASTPAELSPELCRLLAQELAVSWGKSKFDSPELCRTSLEGKVGVLVAAGMEWGDAIASWIESVQPVVVRH